MAAQADALGQDARHNGSGADGEGALVVDLAGQSLTIRRSDVVTFGRAADFIIDESNPYLHRVVGRFFWHGSWWWLENLGSFIELEVVPTNAPATRLPARELEGRPVLTPLAGPSFQVLFHSGGVAYEMRGRIDEVTESGPGWPPPLAGTATGAGIIVLAAEERDLLTRLAEPSLRDPSGAGLASLPTDEDLAVQMGWPVPRVARKLDHLGSRLCKAGVRGAQGQRGQPVAQRRQRLAQHAVDAGLVAPTRSAFPPHLGPH